MDKKKFENLVLNGSISLNNSIIKIKYSAENKGQITFLFDEKSFDLSGWEVTDLNGNYTSFMIDNLSKNKILDKKLFNIPEIK